MLATNIALTYSSIYDLVRRLPDSAKKHLRYMCMSSPIAVAPVSQPPTLCNKVSGIEYTDVGIQTVDPSYMVDMPAPAQIISAVRTRSGTSCELRLKTTGET